MQNITRRTKIEKAEIVPDSDNWILKNLQIAKAMMKNKKPAAAILR